MFAFLRTPRRFPKTEPTKESVFDQFSKGTQCSQHFAFYGAEPFVEFPVMFGGARSSAYDRRQCSWDRALPLAFHRSPLALWCVCVSVCGFSAFVSNYELEFSHPLPNAHPSLFTIAIRNCALSIIICRGIKTRAKCGVWCTSKVANDEVKTGIRLHRGNPSAGAIGCGKETFLCSKTFQDACGLIERQEKVVENILTAAKIGQRPTGEHNCFSIASVRSPAASG